MKAVEVLIAAKALILTESTYTSPLKDGIAYRTPGRIRGTIYEDARGRDTLLLSKAVCFCSLGAINAAVGADAESDTSGLSKENRGEVFYKTHGTKAPTKEQRAAYWKAVRYLQAAIRERNQTDVVGLNDKQHSHDEVLTCFDLAIRNAKRRHINGQRYAKTAQSCTLA